MRGPLVILCVLVLLGLAVSFLLRSTATIGRDVGGSPTVARLLADDRSPVESSGSADLTLVVFTDYQCPSCRKAEPAFRSATAHDGNLRIVYKDWPIFGERSVAAARVALAAGRQGLYGPVHEALMRAPALDDAAMRRAVEGAGGDWQRLQAELARNGPAIARDLARNREEAFSLGLSGTPGYLIGPYLVEGALGEAEFRRAIAQARARLPGES